MKEEKELLKEIEKESAENIKAFSEDVNKVLSEVSQYTEADIYSLYKIIQNNLKDLSDIEISTNAIKEKVANFMDAKERLNFQKDMTREDILEENYLKIYVLYIASAYLMWTPDVIEFIKRIIIIGIIGFVSYDLNARYFTSERRKKKVKLALEEIDKYVEISKYDIATISKFREMYIEELQVELSKLVEISDFDNKQIIKVNNRIIDMISELDLERDLEDEIKKLKIRRR